ncbi:glycerol kinase GlpK [Beduini massiliensis]|uniref:glycerol kinase GlpK n=1 Tax=Beduini massiliensis TaxID=1585974 RepID=UPI00059AA302|nr:glycerol kinase GlpK [Beduini massiliensis]
METYIMAIDQGTTSTRAILFDKKTQVIGIAQKELENFYPQPGWVEQDANDIWASVVGVMFEVLAKTGIKAKQIAAIGMTNQRETTVVWDKAAGKPIYNAIVWQSRQSDRYTQQLKENGKEPWIKQKTGLLLDPYFSASKIRFILDETDSQQRAEAGELLFGTIDTWLLYKLTEGKQHMSDVSNASRTLLMNLETLDYDEELLALWNIPRCMLPSIVDTSRIYGYCEGLFDCQIPICSIVGDQQAALFGQTCFKAGDVKNTYGTGCFLLMNTEEHIIHSKNGLVTSVGWRINGKVNYVLEGSVFIAGAAVQWLRDGLKIIRSAGESEERAYLVEDNEGVYVVPSFTGLGAPYWKPHVKGAIYGLTRGTKQEHIIRATLESLAYQTSDVISAMKEDANLQLNELKVDGGASMNQFLLQFQSDVLNIPVKPAVIQETTALGAAYLAGLAIGYWKDQNEICQLCQNGTVYEPKMAKKERTDKLKQWDKAIKATILFGEE